MSAACRFSPCWDPFCTHVGIVKMYIYIYMYKYIYRKVHKVVLNMLWDGSDSHCLECALKKLLKNVNISK